MFDWRFMGLINRNLLLIPLERNENSYTFGMFNTNLASNPGYENWFSIFFSLDVHFSFIVSSFLSIILAVRHPASRLSLSRARLSPLSLSLSLSLSSHSLPTSLSTLHLLDSQGSFQGNFLHKTLIISILSSQLYAYICVH